MMAISNKTGKLVLTTGNKSEMAVGYATLYGDMAGGYAPLKDLSKTLTYELANWRNSQEQVIPQRIIDRPPSAELRPDQKEKLYWKLCVWWIVMNTNADRLLPGFALPGALLVETGAIRSHRDTRNSKLSEKTTI